MVQLSELLSPNEVIQGSFSFFHQADKTQVMIGKTQMRTFIFEDSKKGISFTECREFPSFAFERRKVPLWLWILMFLFLILMIILFASMSPAALYVGLPFLFIVLYLLYKIYIIMKYCKISLTCGLSSRSFEIENMVQIQEELYRFAQILYQ